MLSKKSSILRLIVSFSITCLCNLFYTQDIDYYFPEIGVENWETETPENLGWCINEIDTLISMLDHNNTKAFLVLHNGKIVLEEYFDDFTQDSSWFWFSAGKTIMAWNALIASQDGLLNLDFPSSNYLGDNWSSCTSSQENQIKVYHHLTMTTGLDDDVEDLNCTDPNCLGFLEIPGSRWAYHNAPYSLLGEIIESATSQNLNSFTLQNLQQIGMSGIYIPIGDLLIFRSRPRDMARFGVLMQNSGNWDGTQLLNVDLFNDLVTPSQNINQSYGYLWWLNGQNQFMLPGSQFEFKNSLFPNAPSDLICALGKNGQLLHISNSENLIVIRLGDTPEGSTGNAYSFNYQLWQLLNPIINCTNPTLIEEAFSSKSLIKIVDQLGREVEHTINQILFYIYDDGSVEKKFVVE